jgi:hypothetical protein
MQPPQTQAPNTFHHQRSIRSVGEANKIPNENYRRKIPIPPLTFYVMHYPFRWQIVTYHHHSLFLYACHQLRK